MTRVEKLMQATKKLLTARNEANDVARELGAKGDLYEVETDKQIWREALASAHTKDKADMVAEVVLSHYPSGCIQ